MMILSIITTVILLSILFYHHASLFLSSLILLAWTAVLSVVGLWSAWLLAPLAIILVPFNFTPMRKSTISAPVFRGFRKVMPPMSRTEKEATDVGTTWWEGGLFQGKPDWKELRNYLQPHLAAEGQAFIDGPVEEACHMANDFQITYELVDLPPELWAYLRKHRFFAMVTRKEHGGLEPSAYARARVLQRLSSVPRILAITVGIPNSLGPGELLQHYGTEGQRGHYLPRLARGQEIPCFALTSPGAGSNAGAIPDTGVVCMGDQQSQQVLGMRLIWNERYIMLVPIATVLGLAFKLSNPKKLLGDEEDLGITYALIPTSTPGVQIGRRHFLLNALFQSDSTLSKGVFVPTDYIIGGPRVAGQGWHILVGCLSVGRGITLPSNSTGGAKSVATATGAYAHIRRQFKIFIGKIEGIEEPSARIAGNAYMMDTAASLITYGIMLGERPAVLSTIVKYHCTHRGRQSVIDVMDITSGRSIMLGGGDFFARAYQDAPIATTVGGANILTRSMMIFGRGAIRYHPYVLEEMAATQSNDVNAFDRPLLKHVDHVGSSKVHSFWFGLIRGLASSTSIGDATERYYQHLSHLNANLVLLSNVPMAVLGGSLKHHERISARSSDVLSQLCLASTILKRYDDKGCNKADLLLVHWGVQDALYRAEQAMDDLLKNFPNRLVAGLLNVAIFPTGRHYNVPSDKLDHRVTEILQVPSAICSRIGRGQYLTPNEHNPVGLLEEAPLDVTAADLIRQRICKELGKNLSFTRLDKLARNALAKGLTGKDEAAILVKAEASRLRSINMNGFESKELATQPVKLPKRVRRVRAA